MLTAEQYESSNGLYVATYLPLSAEWMVGSIQGEQHPDGPESTARLVLSSLTETTDSATTCTDGRFRLGNVAGDEAVHVREQLVGAALVTGFMAAETLGKDFYSEEINDAPVGRRINYVADFLARNGETLTSHQNCGGADHLPTIIQNGVTFSRNQSYNDRVKALVPEGVYDPELYADVQAGLDSRELGGAYIGYDSTLITAAVNRHSAKADRVIGTDVERYLDDGRGVHGHRESTIVRVATEMGGIALAPNVLAEHNLQAFGINGSAIGRLADLFSNGGDKEASHHKAWLGMEKYTNDGHGTLAKSTIRTLVVGRG